jgi:hypothetical protein
MFVRIDCAMLAPVHPLRRADVETYVLPDGTSLLFDPISEAGHPLDVLRSLIWDYCDGSLSDTQIAQEVAELLPEQAEAASYALHVLEEFGQQGLLAPIGRPPGAS